MPLSDQPLFRDPETRQSFPAPIALTLELMASEIETSGEITTADELARVIEAVCKWLGRVWVAEYLHATTHEPERMTSEIHAALVQMARDKRPTTTGPWLWVSRRIRDTLEGWATVVPGLAAIDIDGDLSPLLTFRNAFSHGSFATTLRDIRAHRQLLHDVLAKVPHLRTIVPLHRSAVDGQVRRASLSWPVVDAPQGVALPPSHPVMVGPDGRTLDLYPLLHVLHTDSGLSLKAPTKAHPIAQLTEHTALAAWVERYERMCQGHLSWTPDVPASALPTSTASELRDGLTGLVLVQGWPGCGARAAIDALSDGNPHELPLERFAERRQVCIQRGEPSQSGLTIARTVLRMTEAALGEPEGSRAATHEGLLSPGGPLQQALDDLTKHDCQLLLGLDNLHEGLEPYRDEPHTVMAVYQALIGSPVTVVATTVPGAIDRPIYDRRIDVPIATAPQPEQITRWINQLLTDRPDRTRILRVLAEHPPMHLFALCDALEASTAQTVFEPQVERALWDLRPLLTWTRESVVLEEDKPAERVRVWTTFSPALRDMLPPEGQA